MTADAPNRNATHETMSTYDRTRWTEYTALASRRGWFRDLFAIWQREHGIRIATAARPTPRSRMQVVRDCAKWCRMRTLGKREGARREVEGRIVRRGLDRVREKEEDEGSLDMRVVDRRCGMTGEEEEGVLE